nr:hypothetical protein [Tanacetum cinerariifolium]
MLIQHPAKVVKGSGHLTEPQHTPTTGSPSHIVPIFTVASSSQPKKTQKHRKTKRNATEISQSSGPTTLVADKTDHEERGDRVEMATTTAASLDAEQDSGFKNYSSKEESQKVRNKRKSRTPQPKRRLFKVRIESSSEKSLGDQEDASNQGRNDQDKGISFVKDAKIQGRYGHDIEINTASTSITTTSINITTAEPVTIVSTPITTAGVSVSTVEPSTPPTIKIVIEDEDLIISQTLMKIRSEKPKEKAKERGSKENSNETTTRPTKGVIIREDSETTTRPTVPP